MFVYPEKDDAFIDCLARYLKAGLDAGEMCVCALSGNTERLHHRLRELSADPDSAASSGQLSIIDPASVYLRGGTFDRTRIIRQAQEMMTVAQSSWNGMRAYGDTEAIIGSRTIRLKLLEYEAIVNRGLSFNIALCGYQSNITPRSLLAQARSVHPFIAGTKSFRKNRGYLCTERFLSSFYKFRRVSRVYPASEGYARAVRRDLEEVAARTPFTMTEIEEMKIAVGEAFTNALEHGCRTLSDDKAHIHVSLSPQPTKFVVQVRDHGSGFSLSDEDLPDLIEVRGRGLHLMRRLMDHVRTEPCRGDTIVVMWRRYSSPFNESPPAR